MIVASKVVAIADGQYHSLFLKSDGSLWAMGQNSEGQLGDGFYGYGSSPGTDEPEQVYPVPAPQLTYSVPARFIGRCVRARVYERRFLSLDSPPWRTATLHNFLCPPPCVELAEPVVDFSVYAALGAEANLRLQRDGPLGMVPHQSQHILFWRTDSCDLFFWARKPVVLKHIVRKQNWLAEQVKRKRPAEHPYSNVS